MIGRLLCRLGFHDWRACVVERTYPMGGIMLMVETISTHLCKRCRCSK